MADQRKKPAETGVVSRLADRGEDALTRLMDELGRNSVVTEALARAMTAKGVVDERTRKTLSTIGLAAADEIKDLRGRLERLERRLAQLERAEASGAATKTRTKTQAARKSTGSRSTAKKTSGSTKRSTGSRKSGSSSRSSSGGTS